jgi:murein tripeptide amidase MpaA
MFLVQVKRVNGWETTASFNHRIDAENYVEWISHPDRGNGWKGFLSSQIRIVDDPGNERDLPEWLQP